MPQLAIERNKPKKLRALRGLPELQVLLSTEQARKILGISFTTVKSYIERGFLDPIWIGHRRRFHRDEIENLILNGCGERSVVSRSKLESS